MIQVKSFFGQNDLRNFSYLIFDPDNGKAWVIDPYDSEPIIKFIRAQGLNLERIMNTHQHWDHIRGNSGLQSLFQCEACSVIPGRMELDSKHSLESLATPGHTSDHQAYLWKSEERPVTLFSGDTLFNSGVGNCRGGGNVDDLYLTTKRLMSLTDETILYPGHDYLKRNLLFALECEPSNLHIKEAIKEVQDVESEVNLAWTLGRERLVNPFLRLNSEEIRQNLLKNPESLDDSHEIERQLFKTLRSKRDHW
jgi:hydroxyacylglutathione hydrolase